MPSYRAFRRHHNSACGNCGTPLYKRPTEKICYCSMACWNAKRPRKKARNCAHCGGPISGRSLSSTARFCSISCSNRSRVGTVYDGTYLKSKAVNHRRARRGLIERDGERCKKCDLAPVWMGMPLVLQIDHIDGDRTNNDLSNLRLLCPNCHTQTPTHGTRKGHMDGQPGRHSALVGNEMVPATA